MKDLIITHDYGFFSCCSVALEKIILFHNEKNFLPSVDRKAQYSLYKDHENDSINHFFEIENTNFEFSPELIQEELEIDHQFSDYSLLNYPYIKKIIDIYFKPNDKIKQIEKNLVEKYNIDFSKIIAVFFRGTDKRPETTLPSYETFLEKIQQLKKENPDHKILIQTDELGFMNFIKPHLENPIEIIENKKIEYTNIWIGVHHTIPVGDRVLNGQTFLATVLIMSKCDKIIMNSGNIGLWTCLYRGHTNGVYQFLSNGYITNEKTRNQKIGWIK